MKRILITTSVLDRRGAEKIILELAQRLDRRRFTVVVACLRDQLDMLSSYRDRGLEVRVLGMSRIWQPGPVWALSRLIQTGRFNLIHTHLYRDALFGRGLGWFWGIPVISTLHSCYAGRPGYELALDKMSSMFARQIIAVSSAVRDFAVKNEKISPKKIRVIHNGVETKLYQVKPEIRVTTRKRLGLKEDELVIGTMGRLSPEKGQDSLIKAFSQIVSELPRIRLVIFGEGRLRSELGKLAETLGLEDRVIFPGFISEVPAALSALDIFVLPSLQEGLSVSLIEAMAAGLPCLASSIPGIMEAVGDENCAVLFDPGDLTDFSEKLLKLSKDREERIRLGRQAQARAKKNFELNDMIKKYEKVYDEFAS